MKICLVNPTKTIQKLVSDLSEKYKVEAIPVDNNSAVDTVKSHSPQIVIINWQDEKTSELCSSIKRLKNRKNYTYIIIMGTGDDIEGISSAVKAGADDFVIIPFSVEILTLKINIAIKNIKIQNTLISTRKKLIKSTREDSVTSVLNRRSLLDEMTKEMGRASRKDEVTSALMVYIQNLKEIELNNGNQVTDKFLSEFSRRLNKSIRPYDIIGRYGSSKFLVYLPHTDIEGAKIVSERMLENLNKNEFTIAGKRILPCFSIGISELDPDDINIGKTKSEHDDSMNELILESFIRRSDFAAERGCEKGKGKIEVYSF